MRLSFYAIDSEYCDFLRQTDSKVVYNAGEKQSRPFIGVVFEVREFFYFAPLASPKPKHMRMQQQIDLIKINGGRWGVINLNNMIPVPLRCLRKLDLTVEAGDDVDVIQYKALLSNQLSWCNSNSEIILRKAGKLYTTITSGAGWPNLADRCCDFFADEQQCKIYTERFTSESNF